MSDLCLICKYVSTSIKKPYGSHRCSQVPVGPLEASPRTRHSTWVGFSLNIGGQDPKNGSELWVPKSTNGLKPSKLIYSTNWVNWLTSFRVKMHQNIYQNQGFWCVEWCWMMLNVQTFDNYLCGYTWRLEAHQKAWPVAAVWLRHAAWLAVIDPQILTTFFQLPSLSNGCPMVFLWFSH